MAKSSTALDRPAVGTALAVTPEGDETCTSSMQEGPGPLLTVSPVRNPVAERIVVPPGTRLTLGWQADDGFRTLPTELVGEDLEGRWRLRPLGSSSVVQRREHVRAPIGLPVTIAVGTNEMFGSTVDLSEGGMRVILRPWMDLGRSVAFPKAGETLSVTLDLYTNQLPLLAQFVRRHPRPDDRHEWSFRFHDMTQRQDDLLRAHVFSALRAARARGLA